MLFNQKKIQPDRAYDRISFYFFGLSMGVLFDKPAWKMWVVTVGLALMVAFAIFSQLAARQQARRSCG